MRTYKGTRDADGNAIVTVDGEPLPPRNEICNHSPDGFEWGYGGSGPAQLALAILVDYFGGSGVKAAYYYQQFKWDIIANLPKEGWKITTGQIDMWIEHQPEKGTAIINAKGTNDNINEIPAGSGSSDQNSDSEVNPS